MNPLHIRAADVALVAAGGALGTGLRALVAELLPHEPGTWAWSTLVANVVGAFAMGVLLTLAPGSSETDRRRRLLLGTGVLGGLTTFSTLALDIEVLMRGASTTVATGYLAASTLGVVLACAAGWQLANRRAPVGQAVT